MSRTTLASIILEIRRRATAMPQDVPREVALEQAATELLKDRDGPAERVLAALVGIGEEEGFDVSILDAMTPETIARLDMLAGEIIDFGQLDDVMHALATAMVKRRHH